MTRLVAVAVVLLAVAVSTSAAGASRADDTILNQLSAQDSAGGTVNGPDLSSLTVTSYADGTISFLVQFANRQFIQPYETVQIFIDLDDNGTADLNLSIWPTGDPSYLARWDGTQWSNIRQLPELSQTPGQFSVRLSLAELQSAAAVGVAPTIGVSAGSWTEDPSTGALEANADDLLPDDGLWFPFPIQKPAPVPPPPPPPKPSPARMTVKCVDHKLTARVTPGKGSKVSSVSFAANGTVHRTTKPPYVATIPTRGKSVVTVAATVHTASGAQTLHARARACS
ncbi:MAG TPA: hypothetical protein VFA42_04690 [Gaiellaceae bacterium]|nr:hypothetical protein [Gaiellaceae bacterium]